MDTVLAFRPLLSSPRAKRMDGLQKREDKIRCVLGELLLRYARYRDGKAFCTPRRDIYGKPYIPDDFFSLSHSGKYVVLAYGGTNVGVDVEQPQDEIEDCRQAFSEAEQAWIYEVPEAMKKDRFLQIWTLKESYLKMRGTGFLTDPAKTSIVVQDDRFIAADDQSGKLWLKSVRLPEGYYLGLCSQEREMWLEQVRLSELMDFLEDWKEKRYDIG